MCYPKDSTPENCMSTGEAGFFFFQAEDGIRGHCVTGVQTCALPICEAAATADGALFRRASTPLRLASESIRNCDDTTTRWPAERPCLISVWPPLSIQIGRASCRERV